MEVEDFDVEIASITYDIIESRLPVTYIYSFLRNDKNFSGEAKKHSEGSIKFLEYKDAIITIDNESYELMAITLSELTLAIAAKNTTSKNAKKIIEYICGSIPESIKKKIQKKEYYRTIVKIKTSFRILDMVKDEFKGKMKDIMDIFPNFEGTEKDWQSTGIHFRIVPEMKGEYATKVAKGIAPVESCLLSFDYASNSDYEKKIITVVADLEDTKIRQALQRI